MILSSAIYNGDQKNRKCRRSKICRLVQSRVEVDHCISNCFELIPKFVSYALTMWPMGFFLVSQSRIFPLMQQFLGFYPCDDYLVGMRKGAGEAQEVQFRRQSNEAGFKGKDA